MGLFQYSPPFSYIFSLTGELKPAVLTELYEIFEVPRLNNKGL